MGTAPINGSTMPNMKGSQNGKPKDNNEKEENFLL